MGISAIALTVYLSYEAYKQTDIYFKGAQDTLWLHDYDVALAQATAQNKKMIIDISAPYCSICKAIDKKIFAHDVVQEKLAEYVPVKIDDIEANEKTLQLQKKFNIVGAPTILVYDPIHDREEHRWGGELYEYEPEQFANILG